MKKLIALLLVLAMMLSLAACGGKTEEKAEAPAAEAPAAEAEVEAAAVPADSMVIGMQLDPESFNPWIMANDARQQCFYNKIYETLAFLRPDGSREYVLAKSVEPNGQGCYKVILHDNISTPTATRSPHLMLCSPTISASPPASWHGASSIWITSTSLTTMSWICT